MGVLRSRTPHRRRVRGTTLLLLALGTIVAGWLVRTTYKFGSRWLQERAQLAESRQFLDHIHKAALAWSDERPGETEGEGLLIDESLLYVDGRPTRSREFVDRRPYLANYLGECHETVHADGFRRYSVDERNALWEHFASTREYVCSYVGRTARAEYLPDACQRDKVSWKLRQPIVAQVALRWEFSQFDLAIWEGAARAVGAGNDVEKFGAMFGIDGLVTDRGVLEWIGCTQRTPECSTWYVGAYLQLNMPPCCARHLRELFAHLTETLDDAGIPYWLDAGSMLGRMRHDGDRIPWDTDVDIGVWVDDVDRIRELAKTLGGNYGHNLHFRGPWEGRANVFKAYFSSANHIYIDLYAYERKHVRCGPLLVQHCDMAVVDRIYRWYFPIETVLPLERCRFLDSNAWCVADPQTYLSLRYGHTWRSPEYKSKSHCKSLPFCDARRDLDTCLIDRMSTE